MDHVYLRPRRQREHLDHASGRNRREASLEGPQQRFHFAELGPGRQIHICFESPIRHRLQRNLDVPHRWRLGRADYQIEANPEHGKEQAPECHGRGRFPGWKVSLLRGQARLALLQPAASHLAHRAPRPQDRGRRRPHSPDQERVSPSAFAGRQAGSLRHALRDRVRLAFAQPGKRRRPLGEVSGHARRSGIPLYPRRFPGYAFLPGGKEIVYNQDGKIKRLDLVTGTEKIIPFTAQVSQELGPKLDFPQKVEQGPVKVRLIMDPVESPDGKKLAFSAMTHLYTMDLPGGKPQRLTRGSAHEFQPAWSLNGKSIVYDL